MTTRHKHVDLGEEHLMIITGSASTTRAPGQARRWLTMIILTALALVTASVPALAAGEREAAPSDDRLQVGVECAEAAINAGWTGEDLVISVAVSLAESDCTPWATHDVGAEGGACAWSQDLGAWQLNDCWWDVDPDRWRELQYNADFAYMVWEALGWPGWTTYNNGMYLDRMTEARAAIDAAGGGGGDDPTGVVTTGDGSVLHLRSGPSTSDPVVGSLAEGTVVAIICQTHGESVYSDVWEVSTDLWDQLGPGEFVTDAYVDTGSHGQVAPDC